jgi:hypothetical protein
MLQVRYNIATPGNDGSHVTYGSARTVYLAAWLLLRTSEPHRSIVIETVAYCGSCHGAGKVKGPRGGVKTCPQCKGKDSQVVTSVEFLTRSDMTEGM